jgi:5-methylcytosine-specific restriction enzyme A
LTGRLYDKKEWHRRRRLQLKIEPLCRFCKKEGRVVAARHVDHIIPHKGDVHLFWDEGNIQSLCVTCHNKVKKQIEINGYTTIIGEDGYPMDDNHPVNRERGIT